MKIKERMGMKNVIVVLAALSIGLLGSCKKDDSPEASATRAGGYLIVNEGGFGKGNATLGHVNKLGEYEDAIFETENERKLGDVFQTIFSTNEHHFLVVNNSAKIEVLNKKTFKVENTLENLGSPRYMVMAGAKGWVNDLFSPKVTYFDITNPSTTTTINLNGTAASIASAGDLVHMVVNGKLVTIDATTMEQKSDSMNYGMSLITALTNNKDEIYALAKGTGDSMYALKIDGTTKELKSKLFIEENTSWLSVFRYSARNGEFSFYDNNTIYEISTANFDAVNKVTVPSEATYVYSYTIHPVTGDYYLCDAKDFVQAGEVIQISKAGVVKNKVNVGINPNSCIFLSE